MRTLVYNGLVKKIHLSFLVVLVFGLFVSALGATTPLYVSAESEVIVSPSASAATSSKPVKLALASSASSRIQDDSLVRSIPFFSQIADIRSTEWKKLACGVTSVAMIVDFYHPNTVSPEQILKEGLASGAYVKSAGWSHQGLASLARRHGLTGTTYDLSKESMPVAFAQFSKLLEDGPIIASVYYTFDPKSPIPHLVVINDIQGDTLYYNDPAAKSGGKEISAAKFMKGWKKRFIVIRPQA